VDLSAGLDLLTGVVTWTFTSIDPTTLDEPAGNPLEGFLPPDDASQRGEGWVSYTIRPKASDATGTTVTGKATVIFDTGLSDQSSLDTAPVSNTIDAAPPVSSVQPLPATAPAASFPVRWSGMDDAGGSGIGSYTIYVSDNGGPFTPWLTNTTLTSAIYAGQDNHSYGFLSVATDNVGNQEATPTTAQATTTVLQTTVSLVIGSPTITSAGSGFVFTVQAEDASNNPTVGFSGTVSFATTDPQGSVPAPVMVTNGFGYFLATLKTVTGSPWTITATSGSLSATSAPITVRPGPAVKLAFAA